MEDIDLKARTVKVVQTRVLCDHKVRIEPPKSTNEERILPLDDALTSALERLRKAQVAESERAGWHGVPGRRTGTAWMT